MRQLPYPCAYLVTDRRQVAPGARTTRDEIVALEGWLDDAIAAGVDAIQIRERDLDAATLAGFVRRVVARAAAGATAILVNDRVDVALAAAAHGVHLREASLPTAPVRSCADWLIGRSIHGRVEAGPPKDVDYLMFGTVFASASKPAGSPVQGIEGLARITRANDTPVVAIGGIDIPRAGQCIAAGAAGVAAIGIFLPEGRTPGALGPARAVRELRAAMGKLAVQASKFEV